MQMRSEMRGMVARVRRARGGRALSVAIALAGVLALAAGALGARGGVVVERGEDGAAARGQGSSEDGGASVATAEEPLVVDVGGAVVRPGVVRVAPGSRVADAIAAAGGLAEDADVSGVNQAAPVADGVKVQVPRAGEAASAAAPPAGGGTADPAGAPAGAVNINTAGAEELATLPGIGPATARAIIEDRAANGAFAAPEDLMRVSGIGEKRFERMRDRVVV